MVLKKEAKKKDKTSWKTRAICEKCSDWINLKEDHYVCLSTYNRIASPNHHSYFHFSCWVDYFRECVEQRVLKVGGLMKQTTERLLRSPIFNQILDLIPKGKQLVDIQIEEEKPKNKKDGKRKIKRKN